MKQCNYVISEIIDKSTGKRSEDFSYRIGRECYIDDRCVVIGNILRVDYPYRNSVFFTSRVVNIDEDDHGVWIETMNSKYRFVYI